MRAMLAISIAGLTVSAAATAQTPLMPQSDYRVKAEVDTGESGTSVPMSMYHHEGKMRVETTVQGQSSAILMDVNATTVTVLINARGMRMAMDVPVQEAAAQVPRAPQELGQKIASDTVAGESCNVYRLPESADGEVGQVCMTSDNIMLRMSDDQNRTLFKAQEFERAPQDPALFEVPAGYRRMQMPTGMGSMSLPGQ